VAGLVIARQWPETAKGVTFLLIEDERGTANLIVGRRLYERSRLVVRSAPLILAQGRLEQREGATNVVVEELRPLEAGERTINPADDGSAAVPNIRLHRLAELRAVAPTGHNFG
jgi:error-prone DNA polymerase